VERAAEEALEFERARANEKKQEEKTRLSGAIRLLASLVDAPPLPRREELRGALKPFAPAPQLRDTENLLRRADPRERLEEVNQVIYYRRIQAPVNALASVVSGLFELDPVAAMEAAIQAVQSAWRRPFPDPLERERLRAQRDVLAARDTPGAPPRLDEKVRKGLERRMRLASLQAEENARQAKREGAPEREVWWRYRALRYAPESKSAEKKLGEATARLNREEVKRTSALIVTDGERALGDLRERALYEALTRSFIEDPASESTRALQERFLREFPRSALAGEAQFLDVAALWARHRPGAARALAEWQAGALSGRAAERADLYARDPRFSAAAALRQARQRQSAEWRRFLFTGETPNRNHASLDAESARLRRTATLGFLRPLLGFDLLKRLFVLPFGWPLDHQPALDATAYWLARAAAGAEDVSREPLLRERAAALARDKRYREAAETFALLTPPETENADSARRKAERRELREAKAMEEPAHRVRALEELLARSPSPEVETKAREALETAREEAQVTVRLSRAEIVRHPEILSAAALGLAPANFNGKRSDGEITSAGVELREGGVWRYRLRGRKEAVEERPGAARFERALVMAREIERRRLIREEEKKPARLQRFPLQVEGSAAPGIEAFPGLLPPRESPRAALYH